MRARVAGKALLLGARRRRWRSHAPPPTSGTRPASPPDPYGVDTRKVSRGQAPQRTPRELSEQPRARGPDRRRPHRPPAASLLSRPPAQVSSSDGGEVPAAPHRRSGSGEEGEAPRYAYTGRGHKADYLFGALPELPGTEA